MPYFEFLWTDQNIAHLAEHDVTPDEFAEVVQHPMSPGRSRRSGERSAIGMTTTGRMLFCVYRMIDELFVEPVTAYEIGND